MSSLLPVIDAGLPTGIIEPFGSRVRREANSMVRRDLTDLQINLGKLCNQTCTHCHVEAGPTKTRENMDAKTANRIVELSRGCESLQTSRLDRWCTGNESELPDNGPGISVSRLARDRPM